MVFCFYFTFFGILFKNLFDRFHTREDNALPFHYYPKKVIKTKVMLSCSNDKFAKCKASFWIKSKKDDNILRVDRLGKRTLFRYNYETNLDIDNWEIEQNSGNFEHNPYCKNQCPIEQRIYDFDILNSRDRHEIRKEKKRTYTHFGEEAAFNKEFRFAHTRRSIHSNKCEINAQASAWNALETIDYLIERENEQRSAQYHHKKNLLIGIPSASLDIIQQHNFYLTF